MTRTLRVSEDLTLPLDAVCETFAVLGRRGSGKTYTAGVIAEELLEAGCQVAILDPLDAWYGLRASADGKGDGYPVYVFGGSHQDAPLADTSGAMLADAMIDGGWSAIFSMRHLSKSGARRFVAAFCDRLYERKGDEKHRTPLHLVVDEADAFVPQHLSNDATSCYGAIDTIVRRGRRSGFGTTLISQRAAVVSKDVLTQTEVLVCHQTTSPQDRAALAAWVEAHDIDDRAEEFWKSLASLPRGAAWFWSPGLLDVFRRVTVRRKRTFDSSDTPRAGVKPIEPKRLTTVDLARLTSQIQASVEEVKANDPKALRAEIARLKRDLTERPEAAPKIVERDVVTPETRTALEGIAASAREAGHGLVEMGRAWIAKADEVVAALRRAPGVETRRSYSVPIQDRPKQPQQQRLRAKAETDPGAQAAALTGPQQAILDTVAMLGVRGIDANRESVARWLAIHPNGGSYGANLGRLRAEGYLDAFRLTERGEAAARPQETGYDAALRALPDEPKRAIVRALDGVRLSREELAAALGLHPNGGSYGANLGWLRTMGLITARGPIEQTEGLNR